jgi:hypothetical protein
MKTKEDILKQYETYVIIGQPHNTTPIFLKENVLLAMEEYAQQQVKNLNKPAVSNRRKLFDKFYAWLDGLSQAEYDDMSLTDKCEKFFFKLDK